uniref:Uncharacterized protein n=1 Tax=Anguilla anguilla TaxID=7936 RepID=A0A0E9UMG9_ANGAN
MNDQSGIVELQNSVFGIVVVYRLLMKTKTTHTLVALALNVRVQQSQHAGVQTTRGFALRG